ncbi:hypothetical protein GCM10023336_42740 [Streptomyces similanensis]|uniref:Uncharacterized protein n=1 Tax=Streptomyces similanensis TaxID=1274988 RepID=A0ABP9KQ67_9ACTN
MSDVSSCGPARGTAAAATAVPVLIVITGSVGPTSNTAHVTRAGQRGAARRCRGAGGGEDVTFGSV